MKRLTYLYSFLGILVQSVQAQCVMCKSVAEQSSNGSAINSAILYMAFFPYLLITVIGYLWYKNHKKQKYAHKNKQTTSNFRI